MFSGTGDASLPSSPVLELGERRGGPAAQRCPGSRFRVGPETLSRQNPSKTIEFFQYVRKVECEHLVVLTPYGFATISGRSRAPMLFTNPPVTHRSPGELCRP